MSSELILRWDMCLRFIVCHFPHFRYEFLWQRHVALFSIVLFTSYCCAGGQRTENCPFIYFRMIFRLKMFEHFIIQITFFSKISSRITIFAFRITKYFHHLFFNLIFFRHVPRKATSLRLVENHVEWKCAKNINFHFENEENIRIIFILVDRVGN